MKKTTLPSLSLTSLLVATNLSMVFSEAAASSPSTPLEKTDTFKLAIDQAIQISDAYALPSLGLRRPSVAFMSFQNTSAQAQSLLKATANEICERIEIHEHVQKGETMHMQKVDKLTLPAQQTIQLKSGGLHLMLFGLKKPLRAGETIDIMLTFDNNTSQTVNVPIRTR